MPNDTAPEAAADALLALPKEVDARLSYWHGLWYSSAKYHYFFGVVSVGASVISTSTEGNWAKGFSVLAAIATALIGFMHPERRYLKFVRAWRVLDVAAMRYRHGLIDKATLIDAVEKGEGCIAEFEDKYTDTSETEVLAKAAAIQAEKDAKTAQAAPAEPGDTPPKPS
jgi:hypothetical protein